MGKHLTPAEAWADFWQNALPEHVANELYVADRTFRGEVIKKNGTVVRLGAARIARLLNKYAPGRYEYITPDEGYFIIRDKK